MRRLSILFLVWILGFQAGQALLGVPVRIHVVSAEGEPGSQIVLRLTPQGPSQPQQPRIVPCTAETVVDLPAGAVWQAVAEAPGFWSAPAWVAPQERAGEQTLSLRLFPAGTATGTLEVRGKIKLPEALDVRLEASPRAGPGPRPETSLLQCPVEGGRFRCILPAGKLDLRFSAERCTPAYLFDVEIPRGGSRDFGRFSLREGNSLVGWVKTDDAQPAPGAVVRVEPETFGTPSEPAKAAGLSAMAIETKTNERGFFQLESAEAGHFVVTAAKDGYASVRRAGIDILPGLEARIIDPLVLPKPLILRVELDPARTPSSGTWKVSLSRRNQVESIPGEVWRGEADEHGVWEHGGLSPGRYYIAVVDQETRWVAQEFELSPEYSVLHLPLPGVKVRGRVLLGREPLAATLLFRGLSDLRESKMTSDEKGAFEGLLPAEGTWKVELISEKTRLRLKLKEPVEVRRLPGSRRANVDIRVPNTLLRGRVVNEQGIPVRGATAFILRPQDGLSTQVESGAQGEIEVRGLPAGPLLVHTTEGNSESLWLDAQLEEDHESPPLEIVLRKRQAVEGRVFSGRGPVPGARVTAMSPLDERGSASIDDSVTGPAGEFTVKLSAGATMVNLFVLAPGFATRMLAVPLGSPPMVEVPVEPVGGTLVFDLGKRTLEEALAARTGFLAHGGTFIPFATAVRWSRLQRAEQRGPHVLVLPNMEAGDYLLCWGNAANTTVLKGLDAPADVCTRGSLLSLQELTLALPGESQRAGG